MRATPSPHVQTPPSLQLGSWLQEQREERVRERGERREGTAGGEREERGDSGPTWQGVAIFRKPLSAQQDWVWVSAIIRLMNLSYLNRVIHQIVVQDLAEEEE